MNALVNSVKKHADKHYENDGWDIISECYSDSEIEDIIKDAATAADAIQAVLMHIKPIAAYRADICAY
jgi:hypothetical protein